MVTGEGSFEDSTFFLKNVSDKTWIIEGDAKSLSTGEAAALKKGMNINFGDGMASTH
ncbi:hypothetical protein AGMMS50230_02120 [Spirochaetia bacterium]|nr:hypothetical protein AGMMS50230_02120 [Spirochaetia bacterium]